MQRINVPQRVLQLLVGSRLLLLAACRGDEGVGVHALVVILCVLDDDFAEHLDSVDLDLLVDAGADAEEEGHEQARAHLLHLSRAQVLAEPDLMHRLRDLLVRFRVELLDKRRLDALDERRDEVVLRLRAALRPRQQLPDVARVQLLQHAHHVLRILLLHLRVRDRRQRRRQLVLVVLMIRLAHCPLDLSVVCILVLSSPRLSGQPVDAWGRVQRLLAAGGLWCCVIQDVLPLRKLAASRFALRGAEA
mmetsp:Transcript_1596/g.3631  ORF Transcript_1596/g.3631 Transcript_1596/m.3631 type:complete len:248 (-) Transcript_1596:188-931(-)